MSFFWQKLQTFVVQVGQFIDQHLLEIFIYSIPFVLTGLLMETVRFLGYLQKFGLNTLLLITLSLTVGLIAFQTHKAQSHLTIIFIYNLLRLLCVAVVFLTVIVVGIKVKTGASLIGSSQQFINISTLFIIVFYVVALLLLPLIAQVFSIPGKVGKVAFAIFVYIFVMRFNGFADLYMMRAGRAVSLWPLNEHDRIAKFWYTLFPIMDVVNASTPENAVILHPPQAYPWPETGNQFVIRRFLYPRTLIAPEFWDHTQPIDAVLADNGEPTAKNYPKVIGWPTEVFPVGKVVLEHPWKKQTTLTAVGVDQQESLPKMIQDKGSFEGISKQETFEDHIAISAEYASIGDDLFLTDQTYNVKLGTVLSLTIKNDNLLQVAPVVSFIDGKGTKQYIQYPPNLKASELGKIDQAPEEKMIISDAFLRIQEFERLAGRVAQSSYPVHFGVNMGYAHPMPYLYGKSIVLLDKQELGEDADCNQRVCLLRVEHLLYQKKYAAAEKILEKVAPLYRGTPQFDYYLFLVKKEQQKDVPLQIELLKRARKYWIDRDYLNLPDFILKHDKNFQEAT